MKIIIKYLKSPTTIRLVTVALNFFSNILINRSLGIELKGQYTSLINYANFMQLFFNMGICYAYPIIKRKYDSKFAKNILSTVIWLQTILFFIISAVVIISSLSIETVIVVFVSTAMICNSQFLFLGLIDDIFRRNIILLTSTLLYIILNGVAILIFPGNVYIILILYIIKNIYEILWISFKNNYFYLNTKILNIDLFKQILVIGIPTAILSILISCNYNINIFILNWMDSGDLQIGIYGVAYSLSNMLWIVPDAFKELIYNKTAKSDDYNFILKCILLNICFSIIVCIGFAIFGKWFLGFIYGSDYIIAYNVTLLLFIGIIPMVIFKLIHPIYVNNGKSNTIIIILGVAVLTNIVFCYILIPVKGAYGAAISSLISYFICGILFFIKYYYDYCYKKN